MRLGWTTLGRQKVFDAYVLLDMTFGMVIMTAKSAGRLHMSQLSEEMKILGEVCRIKLKAMTSKTD